ncbi:MAG: phosphoribosylglycinamide formyltransferase [Longimicrobiales bacterium]|nr:phosphoribosylglycinamide formyltransferase [Longimicrobiales bacterium]
MTAPRPLNAAMMASGSGSNVQALLDAEAAGAPWTTRLLVSDRPGAGALDRAERAGIEHAVVPVTGRTEGDVTEETLARFEAAGIEFVFLAGYLRLVPPPIVRRYRERILNVHPALLPAFGGKGMWGRHVHEAVLASGARVTGPTVHLVDERYDEGRILGQWPVPVRVDDTLDTLAARVLKAEHLLYPRVAAHVCGALAAGEGVTPLDEPIESFRPVPDRHPSI